MLKHMNFFNFVHSQNHFETRKTKINKQIVSTFVWTKKIKLKIKRGPPGFLVFYRFIPYSIVFMIQILSSNKF